jgi:DNA-binding transcriptional LysR family regulator
MAPDYLVSEDDEVSLVSYPQGCVYRNITENLLATKNIAYKTTYTSTNLLGLLSAVEAGLGLTVMARSTVPGRVKSVSKILSVPELDPVCIGLYYKEHEISAAAQRVVDFLRAGIANLEKIRL